MGIVIGTYNYNYGDGSEPNRQIQFVRNGRNLLANVYVLEQGGIGKCISSLSAERIRVEMESASTKIKGVASKPSKPIGELSLYQQSTVMLELGSREIGVFFSSPIVEKIIGLMIFKPPTL